MPSFRCWVAEWLAWFFIRGYWTTAEGVNKRIAEDRKNTTAEPPKRLHKKFNIKAEKHSEGYLVYTVSPKTDKPHQARILYCHGGGFVLEIVSQHWTLVTNLAERLQAVVTLPIYPLGPETTMLKMYDQVQPLYNELAADPDPTPFWVMGDSAGGTMSLIMTQQAKKAGLPTASRIVPISPSCDKTFTNPEMLKMGPTDPWFDIPGLKQLTILCCPGEDLKNPRISPIYGDLALPPMMLFAGTNDLLSPDAIKLAEMAQKEGTEVDLVVGKRMMHVCTNAGSSSSVGSAATASPPIPLKTDREIGQTPQKPAGKCPFDHEALARMKAGGARPAVPTMPTMPTMPTVATAPTQPGPSTYRPPSPKPERTIKPEPAPQPSPPPSKEQDSPKVIPQMIFNGPVFLGYPPEQLITILQNSNLGNAFRGA